MPRYDIVAARCSCGEIYTELEFEGLRQIGVQHLDDGGPCLQLADCTCGSSVGVWIECCSKQLDATPLTETLRLGQPLPGLDDLQ